MDLSHEIVITNNLKEDRETSKQIATHHDLQLANPRRGNIKRRRQPQTGMQSIAIDIYQNSKRKTESWVLIEVSSEIEEIRKGRNQRELTQIGELSGPALQFELVP